MDFYCLGLSGILENLIKNQYLFLRFLNELAVIFESLL